MDGSFRSRLRRRRAAGGDGGPVGGNGAITALRPRRRGRVGSGGGGWVRPRRRLWSRPPFWVGVALVAAALLGYGSVYAHAGRRTPVLVAARTLPAGTVLTAADVRVAGLSGDRTLMAALVSRSQLPQVLGRRLAEAVPTGTPLPAAALARQEPQPAEITLAVPVTHALGGTLAPGDRVTVLATFDNGAGQAQTRAIARGLVVEAVGRPPAGLDPTSAVIPVTLALPTDARATALALANEEGKLDLLRDGAATATAAIPAASEAAP